MVRMISPEEQLGSEDIQALMDVDPLEIAEQLAEEGENVMSIGAAIHLTMSARKKEVFAARGDTYFHMTTDEYLKVVESLGFEKVYESEFDNYQVPGQKERFLVFWTKGLLLAFDTYCGHINGGSLHYQWEPKDSKAWIPSGGYFSRDSGKRVVIGRHECREGLVHIITMLRERGQILEKWEKIPPNDLWLLSFEDLRDLGEAFGGMPWEIRSRAFETATLIKIASFPLHVRKDMGF